MPNIILTKQCNNHCEFCFAGPKNDKTYLSFEQSQSLLPFIKSFNRDTLHLLGGEPTLNPDFLKILEYYLQNNFKVRIFSNGKIDPPLLDALQDVDGEYTFNVNRSDPQLTKRIIGLYKKFGYKVSLSLTIFKLNQNIDHIIEEIKTFHLKKTFRLGIALPIWPGKQNAYLSPGLYPEVADYIFRFIQKAIQSKLQPEFDCGFPFCFFTKNHKAYFQEHGIQFASHCGIIPDIGPEYQIMPCYPLASFSIPFAKTDKWHTLEPLLKQQIERSPKLSLFEKCNDCIHLQNGNCSGGCSAFRLMKC